jgi:hypothetical protein
MNVSLKWGGMTKRPGPTTLKLPVDYPRYEYFETATYLGCLASKFDAMLSFFNLKANLFLSKLFSL